MKPFLEKINLGRKEVSQGRPASEGSDKPKGAAVIPILAAVVLMGVLLNLGLTQFILKGYLTQDGYAIPQSGLASQLSSGEIDEKVDLTKVDVGEGLYVRALGASDYFIGEDYKEVSSGYPLYARDGQVLYFLDDSLQLVTTQWESLSTYNSMCLSDGMTFNEDGSQASIDTVLLVQVDGGYQVAQETVISSVLKESTIPMNSACAFSESKVVYFSYDSQQLVGNEVSVAQGATITIGENTYSYLDFLNRLGLWEEEQQEAPEEPPAPEEAEPPVEEETEDAPAEVQPPVTAPDQEDPTPSQKPDSQPDYEKQPETPETPEAAGDPVENPNATPEAPAPGEPTTPEIPYEEPKVSFGALSSWIYTISTQATVEDPSGALQGGVTLQIYQVGDDGKETFVQRRVVSASGEVVMGQVEPGKLFHVVAEYEYKDAQNYTREKSLDLGTIETKPFSEAGSIALSFQRENDPVEPGAKAVEIFSDRLQLRALRLANLPDAGTVSSGDGADLTLTMDVAKVETYINTLSISVVESGQSGSRTTTFQVPMSELVALQRGYTLESWETQEKGLSSSKTYEYAFTATDRYGNVFSLTGPTAGSVFGQNAVGGTGHTCKLEPNVLITVPKETNVTGSTLLQVKWNNPDAVPLHANTQEGNLLGDELAALYLVPEGAEPDPANAVELEGYYQAQNGEKTPFSGKFVPIQTNTDGSASVMTQCVITNLVAMRTYTAAVVCANYDISDGKTHLDETIKEATSFLTASLTNLGTISYTAEVDELGYDTARLKFRMNAVTKVQLLDFLSEVSFTLRQTQNNQQLGVVTLKRSDLDEIAIVNDEDGDGIRTVEIPLYLEGEDTPRTVTMELIAPAGVPVRVDQNDESVATETVWDFLLATSATSSKDGCWVALRLGKQFYGDGPAVMELEARTSYVGSFRTFATQGGVQEDVTSLSSRDVTFTTLSQEATVSMDNAFVSTDFIELYNVVITDPDACIQEDTADRGGDVYVRIVTKDGNAQAAVLYLDSHQEHPVLRISGLTTGVEYTMTFYASRYAGGVAMEQNRALEYADPQDETQPTVYTFTTGESVTGSLKLERLSQLYSDGNQTTDSLGILTEEDYYYGVWHNGNTTYYLDDASRETYLSGTQEIYDEARELVAGQTDSTLLPLKSISEYTSNVWSAAWSSRLIAVEEGDYYSIFNAQDTSYLRVLFYYRNASGEIRYYGQLSSAEYFRGNVFQVPSTTSGEMCYMRLCAGGSDASSPLGLILEDYNLNATAASPDLTEGVEIVAGMSLSSTNSISSSELYAYTQTYIPVSSGCVYEITGRDPNRLFEDAGFNSGNTSNYVLFYGSDYTFLGASSVGNQRALFKVPFGAAYCRFTLNMDQTSGTGAELNTSYLSLKLYRQSQEGQYIAYLTAQLQDDSLSQILRGGKYTVSLYTSDGPVSDTDDLTAQSYTLLEEQGAGVDLLYDESGNLAALDIRKTLTFDEGILSNRAMKATLTIVPNGWGDTAITLDTVYFTTNRVIYTISNLQELYNIRNDPAGSYVVLADIEGLDGQVLGSDRPFTGTIDFQGHTLTTTSFSPFLYRVSASGVVKNLVLNYDAQSPTTTTTAQSWKGSVCQYNYGTLQNVIVHYNPDNNSENYGLDLNYSGGIVCENYGTIDGFVVELMKDVRVGNDFGGVCMTNYGTISNGYVCGAQILDGSVTRSARLVHVWKGKDGLGSDNAVISTSANHLGLALGTNASRGTVKNVFSVGDVYIHSDVTLEDSDGTATTNVHTAGTLIGLNNGVAANLFAVGDRYGYNPDDGTTQYILDRGPAIPYVSGRYSAENVAFVSTSTTSYSQSNLTDATIAYNGVPYNTEVGAESLYDYQWYTSYLGSDGDRFTIREMVDQSCYPQLLLPDVFAPDAQPTIKLPSVMGGGIEILGNQVRLQGETEALVTINMRFPSASESNVVTGITMTDVLGAQLTCEILAQRQVDDEYRVDVLIHKEEGVSTYGGYTISRVNYTLGSASWTISSGERLVDASFWEEIHDIAEWKSMLVNFQDSAVVGNYHIAADLDFSACTSYQDWFVNKPCYAILDGGIYEMKEVELTSEDGQVLLDAEGNPRTMLVRGELQGMSTISGVGNTDADGRWSAGRDGSERASLIYNLYGTVRNLVFTDFQSVINSGSQNSTVKTSYVGVIRQASSGAYLENCHVRDSVFYGTGRIGGLVGSASGASIVDCSAGNVRVETYFPDNTSTSVVRLGGLVGSLEYSVMENCFAAPVTVSADNAYDANGVGGLVGYSNESTIESCYAYGNVSSGTSRVGGIAGQIVGTSSVVRGCWSSGSVSTAADYTGGVVGQHSGGLLTNNYTASTVITRSLAATSVHRITSTVTYHETNRRDNYAFAGQYLTYTWTPPAGSNLSPYQFGIWSEADGATDLLDAEDLYESGTWTNRIGIGSGFDCSAVGENHLMPRLVRADGTLLYDQPELSIGYVSGSTISRISIIQDVQNETFDAQLVLYSDREGFATLPMDDIADWSALEAVGAVVEAQKDTGNWGHTYEGGEDSGGRTGRIFTVKLRYGAAAQDVGHYLDSYILTLPVYTDDTKQTTELIQTRLSLSTPVYRTIKDINEWDAFFQDPQFAGFFENVQITGDIDFSGEGHVLNVRVNRLDGDNAQAPRTLKNLSYEASKTGESLVSWAVTSIRDLAFKDIIIDSGGLEDTSRQGGNYKGVVGVMQGSMERVTFENISIYGGNSNYAGMVGDLYGTMSQVHATGIRVEARDSYVGGLVGYARGTSTISDVSVKAAKDGSRNTVLSYYGSQVGGLVGHLDGILINGVVESTDVQGRASVGGAVGYDVNSDERPELDKISNVRVGAEACTATAPGVTDPPNVTVTLDCKLTSSSEHRYAGGVVGYTNGRSMTNLTACNVKVDGSRKSPTDTLEDGSYNYYIGGISGNGNGRLTNSTADHCTVISYGSSVGGISGSSVSWYNTAKDCVIYAQADEARGIGGVSGMGSAERCVAQGCVISGSYAVGGIVGWQNGGYQRQSGAVDCVIIANSGVGGIVGVCASYQIWSDYVTTSQGGMDITVTEEMLSPVVDKAYATTYTQTTILGGDRAGGIVGEMRGPSMGACWVDRAVLVQGSDEVGGIAGRYYGWYNGNYTTNTRNCEQMFSGAEVVGKDYVGGIFGRWARTAGETTVKTADGPLAANDWGMVFAGSVKATGNHAGVLLAENGTVALQAADGSVTDGAAIATESLYDGTSFGYCRIYDGATVNGAAVTGLSLYGQQGPGSAEYAKVLTATATELSEETMYFLSRNTTYGGMGWSRAYWADDSLQRLYVAAEEAPAEKASFDAYQSGIEQEGLVLWLDARNNTGMGYTDADAAVWTDLSTTGNNAVLYWNNKTPGTDAITISERFSYMNWSDGALEFYGGNTNYYAALTESLTSYLQDGSYTVELIYSEATPNYSNWQSVLGFSDYGTTFGFSMPYGNENQNYAITYWPDSTGARKSTSWSGDNDHALYADSYRTSTFVSGSAGAAYYQSGAAIATNASAVPISASGNEAWRVGYGVHSCAHLRISGIRVYDRELSQAEIQQNAAYDQWYYFGGDQPDGAQATSTTQLTSGDLFRSMDGTYTGVLVQENYAGDPATDNTLSRGYYYLRTGQEGSYQYSSMVLKNTPGYGVRLISYDLGNEYFGTADYRYVRGQEGRDSNHQLYPVTDNRFDGGLLLPEAELLASYGLTRGTGLASNAMTLLNGQDLLPETMAYASGVDTVNVELLGDAPAGTTFAVSDGEEVLLTGTWPKDSRTITFTWDYKTTFTVTLRYTPDSDDSEGSDDSSGAQREESWGYQDLARTVMAWGNGYWYLYGSECYDSKNESVDPAVVFVHLYNGQMLDADGTVWDAESGEKAGPAREAFVLTDPQPIWSGSVYGSSVQSFASYFVSDSVLEETQLVVKNNSAYSMPGSGLVKAGCFVVDSYGGDVITTVLDSTGNLVDLNLESPLCYPDDFSASGIREISNTLHYNGNIVLVRYEGGMLVAFNYLNGETVSVLSQGSQDISFWDFVTDIISGSGGQSLLTGGAQQAHTAVAYQKEVESNSSLQTALANLIANEANTSIVDGTGSGVYGEAQPGGLDGELGYPGQNEGGSSGDTEGGEAVEGGQVTENGEAAGDGQLSENGETAENGPLSENGESTPAEQTDPSQDSGTDPQDPAQQGQEGPVSQESEGNEEIFQMEEELLTRYVTVYDAQTGESSVYDLKELVEQPKEQLVTQEERAQQLEEMGFQTTLSARTVPAEVSVSGLVLMVLTAIGTVTLLIAMGVIKRRKFEQKTHPDRTAR